MKWAIQAKKEEKNKPQTFSADGWTGNQRSSQMWCRNDQELLSPEPRTVRNKWAEWLGRGRGKGIRGPRPFVPVGDTNRDKRPLSPSLARLAVGPGTKATYCPGPNGCRDKWLGTKAYSVVVKNVNTIYGKLIFIFREIGFSEPSISSNCCKSPSSYSYHLELFEFS